MYFLNIKHTIVIEIKIIKKNPTTLLLSWQFARRPKYHDPYHVSCLERFVKYFCAATQPLDRYLVSVSK